MKLIRLLSSMVFASLLLSASLAAAFTPATLSYQGSLYDNNKLPVTAVKTLRFNLYKTVDAAESARFWTETMTSVNVTNGRFAVILGNTTPLNPADFQTDIWVGIKVDTDNEMTPRQKLTSVAFALNADNGVPVGGIIMWSGAIANIPAGWALCNGTNGTPDLRSRFVIGADSTGTYTKGATGGEATHKLTLSEMPEHNHSQNQYRLVLFNGLGTTRGADIDNIGDEPNLISSGLNPAVQGGNQAHNNMPPYFALAYIMRTK